MRSSSLKYTVLSWVSILSLIIFLLVPFHGLITVGGSNLVGHYTSLRLWDEVILVLCTIGTIYLFFTDKKIRINTLSRRLIWLIFAYIAVNLVWGLVAYSNHNVSAKALGYGLIVNLRFLIFFLITWSAALRLSKLRTNWQWLVIYPSIFVVVFGLLQVFVLPNDFLKHLGYGPKTIPVIQTINHNLHYIRFGSTTRGANPLGAYLIIPISLLTVLFIKPRRNWKQLLLLLGSVILLFYTFSRSAWLGAIVSVVVILVSVKLSPKLQKVTLLSVTFILILLATLSLIYKNNAVYQNFVLHTQTNSAIKSTSNGNHFRAIKEGVNSIVKHPLGNGPGTSGPASFYNDHKSRTPENYFVQIGEETGWIGLILFILINVGVGILLWNKRTDTLAISLFAALIGITIVNLVSPAWSDDTLAYIWWGLAGVAMAPDKRLEYTKSNANKR